MRQSGRVERLEAARRRDGHTCVWCARELDGRVPATTDHVVPRVKGGPSWLENEVAACRRCNGERGHRGAVDWLEECERGGQRRARPNLDAQLRRLAKRRPSGA